MILLKDLMNSFNCNNTVHETLPPNLIADTRGSYIANSSVLGLDKADFILLIGTNPRVESPVYNARIRKMFLNGAQV
jgi:NADH dehydrogenase/NADH:ubiquinone oxidoreductase subunit G